MRGLPFQSGNSIPWNLSMESSHDRVPDMLFSGEAIPCHVMDHVMDHSMGGYDMPCHVMPCHVMRARSALSTSHVQGGQVHAVRAGRSRLDGNAWLIPGYEMPPLSAVGKTGLKPRWMRRLVTSGCRCRADVLTNSPACDYWRAENQRTLSEPERVCTKGGLAMPWKERDLGVSGSGMMPTGPNMRSSPR